MAGYSMVALRRRTRAINPVQRVIENFVAVYSNIITYLVGAMVMNFADRIGNRFNKMTRAAIGFAVCAYLYPVVASAHGGGDEAPQPGQLSLDLDVELQNDYTTHTSDNNERNNLKTQIELGLGYQLTNELSLNLGLKLEQIGDPDAGKNEYFEKHGAYVETLTVNYAKDDLSLYAGKFTPNFGLAWGISPGIYTKEFAEKDYELSERLGFGGGFDVDGGAAGRLNLSTSTFFKDRTVLSNSVITSRGRTTEASGGPSNTGDFASFAVGIDGYEVPWFETLEYHVAFVHQGKGEGDTDDEQGIVAAAHFTVPLTAQIDFTPFTEYAAFMGRSGVRDRDQQNLTLAARFDYRAWNLTFGHSTRRVQETGLDDTTDYLHQVSIGYAFANGLNLDVGYGKFDDASVLSDVVGFKLSYEFGASTMF
ncbi:MAG: hypothetical protein JWL86_1886 [Rhizobium sp.]|nr:hypothetical protein [Rhizobium sp.]